MKDKQAKYPQLRFKGFTDPWEDRKLKDIAQFNPKTVLPDEFEYVDLESVVGTEIISHRTESKDQAPSRAQRLAQKGDVFYQTVRPYQMNNYLYDLPYDNYVFSTGYAQMRPNIDSYFLLDSVQNKQFVQHVLDRSTGTSYPAINSSDLSNIEIHVPSKLSEQQKIGAFFQSIDDTIALHQRKLDLLKEQKKGYLQKMFPKNGAKVPELRFKGFTDEWEERKFKDILKTHSFRSYLAGVSENGEYEVIQQGDKPIVGYSDGEPFTDYKDVTLFGDHTVSLYKPKSPFFVATDGVKILSADNFEGDYLYTTLERYKPEPQGYKRHFTILKNQDVWFTENMEEQQKIGVFFKQLDDTITLHQRKLDLLKEQKKGFLQNMFV